MVWLGAWQKLRRYFLAREAGLPRALEKGQMILMANPTFLFGTKETEHGVGGAFCATG